MQAVLVEGERAVAEALGSGATLIDAFVGERGPEWFWERAAAVGVEPARVSERVLRALATTVTPQSIVAVFARPEPGELAGDLVLVLHEVADPGNAGTLVRSAVAAGAGAVVFTTGGVDPWSPKTVRSSAGLIFRVPIVEGLPLAEAAARLRAAGLRLLGAAAGARSCYETDLVAPLALVVGNEARGLGPAADLLDGEVGIHMPGPAESLNVAVAGSILLFEAARQRRNR
jgi:TrmH family RNA methyltransferase